MSKWTGATATKIRRAWELKLPLPCSRCGRDVEPGMAWDLDHRVSQVEDPSRVLDQTNLWPAHQRCNRSAGGRLGAMRAAANRPAKRRRDAGLGDGSRPW